ncbi:adenylate/guanylate cyclase domain-containing protein [Prauserella shujinwangii]|nr:adenylate/guanylate cyclase domain-containing protein [Prauserella shujinwangii]
MSLSDEIDSAVQNVVNADWNRREGRTVPDTSDVALSNGAVVLDAVYLYADLADSTRLARDFDRRVAAKVIRSFLDASCRVIKARGGTIVSFDGDRVMGIFVGDSKNTAAAKCGLQINAAVLNVIKPKVEAKYSSIRNSNFRISQCVGIASGETLIVRGGVRGSNDLVSVGRAPNVAAKLSDIRNGAYRTYITSQVYHSMHDSSKHSGDGRDMWTQESREVGGETMTVYGSSWLWNL